MNRVKYILWLFIHKLVFNVKVSNFVRLKFDEAQKEYSQQLKDEIVTLKKELGL